VADRRFELERLIAETPAVTVVGVCTGPRF
jgi:hypothetical protein